MQNYKKIVMLLGFIIFQIITPVWGAEVYDTISPINLTIGYWHPNPNVSSMDQVEKMIRHAAVAVFEATNGAHVLGKIRIVEDPQWRLHVNLLENHKKGGTPWADSIAGGYLPHGQYSTVYPITMGEDFLSDRLAQVAGYTLAHEMGHFVYGVYDEYPAKDGLVNYTYLLASFAPKASDRLTKPYTIMEGADNATTLDPSLVTRALHFSTAYNYGFYGVSEDLLAHFLDSTAQWRMYHLSAWDTIASNAATVDFRGLHQERSQYKDLEKVKPDPYKPAPAVFYDGVKEPLPVLNASDFGPAVKNLDIRWGLSKNARILLVDHSGSIEGYGFRVSVIKTVLKQIENTPRGTSLAVHVFNDTRKVILPMTRIPFDKDSEVSVKIDMQSRFLNWAAGSTPNGGTNLYQSILDLFPLLDVDNNDLKQNGIILSDICVVTDGEDTYSPDHQKSIENIIENSRRLFIPVHMVGVSVPYSLSKTFRQLTKDVGGDYSTQWMSKTVMLDGTDLDNAIANKEIKISESFFPLGPLSTLILRGHDAAGILEPSVAQESTQDFSSVNFYPPYSAVTEMMRRANLSPRGSASWESSSSVMFPGDITRREDISEKGFYIDSSLENFAVHVDQIGAAGDIEITLTDPYGRNHPLQLMYTNDVFRSIGSSYMATFDVDQSLCGSWTLKCENKSDQRIDLYVKVSGQSRFAASSTKAIVHDAFVDNKQNIIVNRRAKAQISITPTPVP